MDVLHLSTSLASGWPQCPLRGWNAYVARNKFGNDWHATESTRFGNVVHEVCEEAHNLHMRGEPVPEPLDLFDEIWRLHDCHDPDYFSLGRAHLDSFLRRTLYGREGDTISTELHFLLDLTTLRPWLIDDWPWLDVVELVRKLISTGGVPVISKIDRVDRDGLLLVITDYKTNAQPFARDEIRKSIQLGLYDLAARAIWPEAVRVKCVYDMVRHGRFEVEFDDERREELRRYLVDLWHQIRRTEVPQPRLNQYCHACELRGNCPAYMEALEAEVEPIYVPEKQLDGRGVAALVEQWEALGAKHKLIEARREELAAMLAPQVVAGDGVLKVGDGREVVLQPNPRYEYPVADIIDLLKRRKATTMLPRIVNVSNTALARELKGIGWKDEVEALRRQFFVASSLRIRNTRPTMQTEEAD